MIGRRADVSSKSKLLASSCMFNFLVENMDFAMWGGIHVVIRVSEGVKS